MIIKNWTPVRKALGLSFINPQFFILREERTAVSVAVTKARGTVVDLGAGDQLYKDLLLQNAKKYIPVDLKVPLNKQAKDYIRADITKTLPFKNSFCETVCLLQVLEYIENPATVFSESFRVLKRNGNLVVSSPFLYPIHDAPHDKVRYTKQALFSLLKKAGFKKIEIQKESSSFAFLANSLNMFILRSLYHKIKRGGVQKIVGLFLLPFAGGVCVAVNIVAIFFETIFPGSSDEFPLNYTVVARK